MRELIVGELNQNKNSPNENVEQDWFARQNRLSEYWLRVKTKSLESKNYFLRFITNKPMPMPASITGIIHIEIDCTPAKSNADVSIGTLKPPITGNDLNTGTHSASTSLATKVLEPN